MACGGWRNNETLSSCTFQINNGHQILRPSMKLRRHLSIMVSIQNQLISIGEVGGYNTMETIQLNAMTTFGMTLLWKG